MLEKRLWPNLLYIFLILLICITLWQMTTTPDSFPTVTTTYSLYTSNLSSFTYPIKSLPLQDYQQLIDLDNFTFAILNSVCNDSSPLLLILIHSAPKNWHRRRIIRETWGKTTHQVKILFVTGLASQLKTAQALNQENEKFGDLIQGTFLDAYRNMTYKHVMVLKYAIYHCPQAKYILKTDDDVFVNMPSMLNFLNFDLSPFGGSKMLFCCLQKGAKVLRSYRSKWRVSFKEYPKRFYPTYCLGWALLYSPDVVFQLYREAQNAQYFWIDDVHVTGTLVERIGLTQSDINNLVLPRKYMKMIIKEKQNYTQSFLYGAPNINGDEIKALWSYVTNHETPISIIKDNSIE